MMGKLQLHAVDILERREALLEHGEGLLDCGERGVPSRGLVPGIVLVAAPAPAEPQDMS